MRRATFTMEQPSVVAANFGLSFSLHVLSIFGHISASIRPITLIWASLERSSPPVEVSVDDANFFCQKWKKSEDSSRPVTAGMAVNGLTQSYHFLPAVKVLKKSVHGKFWACTYLIIFWNNTMQEVTCKWTIILIYCRGAKVSLAMM